MKRPKQPAPLSDLALRVLDVLDGSPRATDGTVAQKLGIQTQTAHVVIAQLEARAALLRADPDGVMLSLVAARELSRWRTRSHALDHTPESQMTDREAARYRDAMARLREDRVRAGGVR
jgi:hypothetical protein